MPASDSSDADVASRRSAREGLASSFRIVSLGTLFSRILGLARDMLLASAFGAGPILDAFTLSFRLPNLARQLFGEGALTAAFLPIFVRELRSEDPNGARQLASAMFCGLAAVLAALVLIAELGLFAALSFLDLSQNVRLLLILIAIQTPYLLCICLAAQLSAVLHSLRQFFWPALLPVCLNLVWLLGIAVAMLLNTTPEGRIQAVAVSVVVGGICQLSIAVWAVARAGYPLRRNFGPAWVRVREVATAMLPIVLGFAVSQLNVLVDSLVAWAAANTQVGALLPIRIEPGTATALFFGQRMYQFPLGIFGVALGTVLFPLLASHAQAGDQEGLRRDLAHGLKLTIAIGVPASAGLAVLSGPITNLLFRRGAFDESDAQLTATMVAVYGTAVWAYIGVLIAYRAFYAIGDRLTPVRISVGIVLCNFVLNVALVCLIGGVGLAIGGAVSAAVQSVVASLMLQSRVGRLDWPEIAATGGKTVLATIAMSVACVGILQTLPGGESLGSRLAAVVLPMSAGMGVYLLMARAVGLSEPWELTGIAGRRRA
ncbi:MAG: murein biosynthesis integral membrane protein MurJ [Planctomycetaceae bacterium]|nr:murein biosynthesis integral membrane protein MurJ [Planctomycetaceae bacterium]